MLTSRTLASRKVSSFGMDGISRHLLPIHFVSKLINDFNILHKGERVAIEAIGGERITTIAKVAETEFNMAIMMCVHV